MIQGAVLKAVPRALHLLRRRAKNQNSALPRVSKAQVLGSGTAVPSMRKAGISSL
jgi:hypothetical protein